MSRHQIYTYITFKKTIFLSWKTANTCTQVPSGTFKCLFHGRMRGRVGKMSVTFMPSLANRRSNVQYTAWERHCCKNSTAAGERRGSASTASIIVGDDELGVGPGQGSIEQPHRPGADEHAGEGVNQVAGFHHDSPTEEAGTPVPGGDRATRPRRRTLAQGPGPALLFRLRSHRPCSGSTSLANRAILWVAFQRPNVSASEESLLTRAAT